jgi:1,4-dihydroxy-2-naphthoate octaprenyltransferase
MSALKIWILAARPKTLIISISPVFLGLILAMCSGILQQNLFFITLITALSIQIGANLVNDYYDGIKGTDTKERIGPLRVTQAGLVSPKSMRRAIIAIFSITAIGGAYLAWQGGWIFILLTAIAIFLAIIYTAGAYSLSYLGIGDVITFFFFGPIALSATYYLQTHFFSSDAFWIGMAPGAFSCAILTSNNLRDMEQDRKAAKKTIPVRFGSFVGKCEYTLMLLIAISIPLFYCDTHPFVLLSLIILFPTSFILINLFKKNNSDFLITLLPKTAQLLLFYTVFFAIGWML